MFYFLISTCLLQENFETRKKEYLEGIQSLINNAKDIPNKKIIIIENSGQYKTSFLDYFNSYGCEVFYTNTNDPSLEICNKINKNKGRSELQAIINCIKHYNISEDDFIVKFTGRYLITENSPFFQCLKMDNFLLNYDAIIKYGSFFQQMRQPVKVRDCVTGLIGTRCKYVLDIPFHLNKENMDWYLEWFWAEATYPIPDNRIIFCVEEMGLNMNSSGGHII